MNSLHSICYSMGLLVGLAGCAVPSLPGPGKVYVDHGADIRGDERRVQEILAVSFNHAEEALQIRNLDELMRLYSRDYAYHGLSKDDLRKIWWDLLAKYARISSTHQSFGLAKLVLKIIIISCSFFVKLR